MSNSPPPLEARGVRVSRGSSFRLEVPALRVERGETLAVLGLNGAGKSTLLEVLALLLKPDSGEVRVVGETARGRPERLRLRRRLSLAMQDPHLLSQTLVENVALPLRLRGAPREQARQAARAWLGRFGIEALAGRPAGAVSGGEARRASLARALVTEPDVLLLDEPFSALDPPTRDALLRDFQSVLAPATAVVLVTHDRYEALALARQVAVLERGNLLQSDAAREVFRHPATPAVAALVGLETLLDGIVVAASEGVCRIEVAPETVVEAVAEAEKGARVTLCVHPEEVILERGAAGGSIPTTRSTARNSFPLRIRSVVPHGPALRVEMEGIVPLAALVTRRSAEELALRPGDSVLASFKASAVHVFPARRA